LLLERCKVWLGALAVSALACTPADPPAAKPVRTSRAAVWDTTIAEVASLVPIANSPLARFGSPLAFAGDIAIFGAPDYTEYPYAGGGVAFVFRTDESGVWRQTHALQPLAAVASARFGSAVALEGSRLVIAAKNAPDVRGRVFVFEAANGDWTSTELVPAEVGNRRFGEALAISGDRVAVGAPADGTGIGMVHVFVRENTTWRDEARLSSGDAYFGAPVALAPGWLAAGTSGADAQALA
jgi:hypothetical protein